MKNNGIADFMKPTIITAVQYGTKVSVEIDHSDTDIDELFESFRTICVGLGYHESSWKQWIVDRADEYREEELENVRDMGRYEPSPELRREAEEYVNQLSERDIDSALAEHNSDEDSDWDVTLNDGLVDDYVEGNNEDSVNGGFDGNPYKQETGTTYFTVPVNFYTDDEGNKVYDYEGMADQFEEQLSELNEDAVVMVSVETNPIFKPNEKLQEAAKKYKKKVKTK